MRMLGFASSLQGKAVVDCGNRRIQQARWICVARQAGGRPQGGRGRSISLWLRRGLANGFAALSLVIGARSVLARENLSQQVSELSGARSMILSPKQLEEVIDGSTVKDRRPYEPYSIDHLMTPKARRKLDRILNDRNLTKLSEADEIMQQLDIEEEEDQFMVGIQSFLGVVVAVTILALFYRGGLWWELWMKEQERRDEEEEIRMTGQFIDPRAERIDDDNNNDPKDQNGGSKSDDKPGPQPEGPAGQDASPSSAKDDGLDALEKLLGN